MPVDKILVPHDPRIQLKSAHLRGRTYGYLYAAPPPAISHRGTIILIHGFPDISMGWRYQIPFFLSLGLTVIAPDCIGYGRSDAPPYTLADYSFKRISDDIAELCRQLGLRSIILGGHDWGGAIVYRVAQYYPRLVSHLFSICTPFFAPNPKYEPLHLLVNMRLPNFRYQEHFASGEIEDRIQSKAEIRMFLNGLYGGKGLNGEFGMDAEKGIYLSNLGKLRPTRLLSEQEMDYYVQEYSRHGIHGPLNWYRTREVNWEDEWKYFFGSGKNEHAVPMVEQECLFVLATKDQALKPFMAERMGDRVKKLTRKEVEAGHWALWEKPEEINMILKEWFEDKVFEKGPESKL